MGQITIYLDDDVEEKMIAAAKMAHLPKSKWVASVISDRVATQWSPGVIALQGAWSDFPSVEDIRQCHGKDAKREAL